MVIPWFRFQIVILLQLGTGVDESPRLLIGFGPVFSENADTNLASSRHLGQVPLHRNSNVTAGAA